MSAGQIFQDKAWGAELMVLQVTWSRSWSIANFGISRKWYWKLLRVQPQKNASPENLNTTHCISTQTIDSNWPDGGTKEQQVLLFLYWFSIFSLHRAWQFCKRNVKIVSGFLSYNLRVGLRNLEVNNYQKWAKMKMCLLCTIWLQHLNQSGWVNLSPKIL